MRQGAKRRNKERIYAERDVVKTRILHDRMILVSAVRWRRHVAPSTRTSDPPLYHASYHPSTKRATGSIGTWPSLSHITDGASIQPGHNGSVVKATSQTRTTPTLAAEP